MADLYVIGLEEVVELTPGHMLATDPYVRQFWEKKILTLLNGPGRKKIYPFMEYTVGWYFTIIIHE